jgi:regulator of protease activity HflC (stomatin/prohibitin superfamily)
LERAPYRHPRSGLVRPLLTTKDNHKITFSANALWAITSVLKYWTKVHDPHDNLMRVAEGFLAREIRDLTYDELLQNQETLEQALLLALRKQAQKWGVSIKDVWLTDLVEARPFRIFGHM